MTREQKLYKKAWFSLAFRLYILLLVICLPSFLLYYFYAMRTLEAVHERQIENGIEMCRFRLADWLTSFLAGRSDNLLEDKDFRQSVSRELQRIVEEPNGLVRVGVLLGDGTGELELVGWADPAAAAEPGTAPGDLESRLSGGHLPTPEDKRAYAYNKTAYSTEQRGGEVYRCASSPFYRHDKELAGVIHLELRPSRLVPSVQNLESSLVYGALCLMVIILAGVVLFVHFAVGRPTQSLIQAMRRAAEGDLTDVVPMGGDEFGRLSYSYNQLMLRLRSSLYQNRKLMVKIRGFNEELQGKIRKATEAIGTKNSQLQAANEKLFRLQRQLTQLEKLASLGQVSTILAHELGSPLNAISGHLQLLLQDNLTDNAVTVRLKVIENQVDRLTGIVRDVLDTMRMPPPKWSMVDLGEVVRGVLDLILPAMEKQGVEVSLQIPEALPRILADGGQLEQLFINLFTNSMDAMPVGGHLTVTASYVESRETDKPSERKVVDLQPRPCIRVDVTDTGEGMNEEIVQRAFEPFFSRKRLEKNARPGIRSGLGLGLAICHQIVKNHRGEILLTSRPGVGTCFQIFFPVKSEKASLAS